MPTIAYDRRPRKYPTAPYAGVDANGGIDIIGVGRDLASIINRISIFKLERSRYTKDVFEALASKWAAETLRLSSVDEITANSAYQDIVRLGWPAVPLMIERLQCGPDHWFTALTTITGIDPVQPEQRGRMQSMAQAWIDWAEKNRILKQL